MRSSNSNLTVVIPYWNGDATIKKLVDSIPGHLPIIIVDDISDKPLPDLNKENVTVLRIPEKGYFTGAVNYGIEHCTTDILCMNQDAYLEGEGAINFVLENRKKYALIGERITGQHPAWPMGYIHGTFMFARRDAIDKVGLMDARHYPLWGSTCDWQLRMARANFKILPVVDVPGFIHTREGNYGTSIQEMLRREPQKKGLLIQTPPAISVVAPCYNHGRYLRDLVNSLIGGPTSMGHTKGQTLQSFEIIIVDDVSRDNSVELAKELVDPWKGIRLLKRKQNGGTPAANNSGIEAARGSHIAMINADDMMLPHRLEHMYNLCLSNPHSVVFDDLVLIRHGRYMRQGDTVLHRLGIFDDLNDDQLLTKLRQKGVKVLRRYFPEAACQAIMSNNVAGFSKWFHNTKRLLWRMPDYSFENILQKNAMHAGLMFPKKAWSEVGGYPDLMREGREDWAFNVALGIKGWCGVKLREPGYLYRREGQNRTLTNTTPQWRQRFRGQMEMLFPSVYQGERPMGCCGGNQTVTTKNKRSGINQQGLIPGQDGMTMIEYTGLKSNPGSYFGEVTKATYRFGGRRVRGYVDNRDLAGFLDTVQGHRHVFQIASRQDQEAATEVKKSDPAPVAAPEPVEPTPIDIDAAFTPIEEEAAVEEVVTVPVYDPSSGNLDALRTYLEENVATLTTDILIEMLEKEQAGKNRAGAVDAINKYL